jgi:hypothetical protein
VQTGSRTTRTKESQQELLGKQEKHTRALVLVEILLENKRNTTRESQQELLGKQEKHTRQEQENQQEQALLGKQDNHTRANKASNFSQRPRPSRNKVQEKFNFQILARLK